MEGVLEEKGLLGVCDMEKKIVQLFSYRGRFLKSKLGEWDENRK